MIDYLSKESTQTPKNMMTGNRISIRILLAVIKKLGQSPHFNGARSLIATNLILKKIKKYSEANIALISNRSYNFDSSTIQIIQSEALMIKKLSENFKKQLQ